MMKKFLEEANSSSTCGSLVPIFDMVNHAQYPNCDWNIDDGVQITTNMPVSAGSEFFINYGPQFNDKLVQYYGFSLDRLDDVSKALDNEVFT